ncbi:MAG TPA: cysteine desulfurase family protein, partial [Chroococcales cyanobacterium]
MQPTIYLDNSATTKVRQEVIEAMNPYLGEFWGNPSSIHQLGRQSRAAVESARQQIANLVGASAEEIFFTPCATYSNNAAILGRAQIGEARGWGRHIITTGIEHSSGLGPVKQLQACGWRVTILGINNDGIVDIEELKRAVEYDTSIISVMWANNEIGSVQPIEEIASFARARGIFFHTDAVQAAGRLPINLRNVQADTLSLSGHKFYGPKGIGVLYIRKGVEVR